MLHNMLRREAIEVRLGGDARAEREPECVGALRALPRLKLPRLNLAIQAGDIASIIEPLPEGQPTIGPAFERGIRHQVFCGQAGEAVLELWHRGRVCGDARAAPQRHVVKPERAG